MDSALFSWQATKSQGGELKTMCSVKPPLRTADPLTPLLSSVQSKLCGQVQCHGDEGPVGKCYGVMEQRAQMNNPIPKCLFWTCYGLKICPPKMVC